MRRLPKPGSVRNVVTGRSDHFTGRVPFARLGVTVAFDSLLEEDFLVATAAFESDVIEIVSQPFWVGLRGETEGLWLPDFRIKRANGVSELVEVKPLEQVEAIPPASHEKDLMSNLRQTAPDIQSRFWAMRDAAIADGYRFRLITEREIRIEPRLSNAKLILRYAGSTFPPDWILEARAALASQPLVCVADLQAALPQWDAFAIALHLAWAGDVELDPTSHFSRGSRFVRVGSKLLAPTKVLLKRAEILSDR